MNHFSTKILIIENEIIIALDLGLQCTKLGYDVIGIQTSAEDAFRSINIQRPNLVIMNIGRKEKALGLKSARGILDELRVPLILISSYTDKETFKQLIDLNPYAFISKPFKTEHLKKGIETALFRMNLEDQ